MMEEKLFNLQSEPWIKVLKEDNSQATVSLLDVFRHAHQFKGLSGEMTAQDIAVLRFLLAILYAVFVRQDEEGSTKLLKSDVDAADRWRTLWQRGSFPNEVIEKYIQSWEDRFWLFHPEHPFLQTPVRENSVRVDVETVIMPTNKPIGALVGDIAESSNKIRLFLSRRIDAGIPFDEAARWLLFLNAFDTAPAGAPGDRKTGWRVKGFGTGWLSKLGLVWVTGNSLFETLMLNFPLYSESIVWNTCVPEWEKPAKFEPATLMDMAPPFPSDLCALYTMPFRSIRLINDADNAFVTGYDLWSGKALSPENAFMEPMTIWRKSKDGYLPKLHDPSRKMWRDFSAILPAGDQNEHVPGVIKWLADLSENADVVLPPLKLSILGISYTNNTAFEHIFSDTLMVNAKMLGKLSTAWQPRINQILQETNRLVYLLAELDRNLRKAAGDGDDARKIEKAVAGAFFALDEPFRLWLESIQPETDDMDTRCGAWLYQAKRIIRQIGEEMALMAGPAAIVGRVLQEDVNTERKLANQVFSNIESGYGIRLPKAGANTKKAPKRYTSAEAINRFMYKTA